MKEVWSWIWALGVPIEMLPVEVREELKRREVLEHLEELEKALEEEEEKFRKLEEEDDET